eukprot:Colp12_sorted_trinity150504_noHs@36068
MIRALLLIALCVFGATAQRGADDSVSMRGSFTNSASRSVPATRTSTFIAPSSRVEPSSMEISSSMEPSSIAPTSSMEISSSMEPSSIAPTSSMEISSSM